MTTILPASGRTSVRPRRYAPKGNRPLRVTSTSLADISDRHVFVARQDDPISCVWCNLPRANGRHCEPPTGRVA